MNIPTNQQKILDRAGATARANRLLVGPGTLNLLPRVDFQTNTSGAMAAEANPIWEGIYGTNLTAGTVAFTAGGITLSTSTTDDSIMKLVAANIPSVSNIFCTGNATRTSATSPGVFATAAGTSSNIGRGLEFSWGITTPSAITLMEIMVGFMYGDASNASRVSTTGPLTGAGHSYTNPTDGFYFFYSAEYSPNWQRVVNRGSTDEVTDTKIPVVASTVYELRAYLDDDAYAHFYINDTYVGKSSGAVDASTSFVPCVGVKTLSGAARTVVAGVPNLYVNR